MINKIADDEKLGCKEHIANLPLSQVITLFKHKYSMSKYVKMNYICLQETRILSSTCLLWCSGHADLRQGLDLSSDRDLCQYLQFITQIRCNDNEK